MCTGDDTNLEAYNAGDLQCIDKDTVERGHGVEPREGY